MRTLVASVLEFPDKVFPTMLSDKLLDDNTKHSVLSSTADDRQYERMQRTTSLRNCAEPTFIFDELPKATILSVSRPDTGDISPMLLSYTIEFQYKQFKWRLLKKASQVLYLHFALKKRAFIEEFHEKQEQVKEWLHSIGIVDHITVVRDDDEPDDGAIPLRNEESVRNRNVPSAAILPIIRPALGREPTVSERAKVAMQNYLNHFLGNLDIVNSREVCKFMEVSRFSFLNEYGPKLKEGYVMVKHLSQIARADSEVGCLACCLLSFCNNNWQKVWAVLKPGFFAFLEDPFDINLLDIIIFDTLPSSKENELARQTKEPNPLRYAFEISCGNRNINLRTSSNDKVRDWVTGINDAALRPLEGWCHPHRFGSFAPQRGLNEDGSQAQWFIDGHAAFQAIASAIENAKSEIFITGWWLCPELYLRRPYQHNSSSRLEALLEEKAKQGVQIYILLYKEVSIALKINSFYSKKRLLNIHENVRVLRYPDHLAAGVLLWSHHEKIVVVDNQVSFIGGLDLCFGRYDTPEHQVADCPPLIFPGKDYYNPRESEPNSWEETMKDELDRQKYPRMPWHDVHCALWGPPCRDIARHFVQRWNHAKRNKAPNQHKIPLLMPHHHMVLPHYMGRSREMDIGSGRNIEHHESIGCPYSSNSPSEFDNIPLLLPLESDGLVTSNMNHKPKGQQTNNGFSDQTNGFFEEESLSYQNLKAVDDLDFMCFDSETVPDKLGQFGEKELIGWQEIPEEDDQYDSTNECGQVGPRVACSCQVIRSVSQWSAGTSQTENSIHSAYCSYIEKAEHFIYIENQFFISGLSGDDIIQNRVLEAIYNRILRAYREGKCFRVIVVIPLIPGFQGGLDDGGAATVRAIMHWQYRTISWEKHSILYNLNKLLGSRTPEYISFYGLRTYGRLFDGGPVATSQVYVHSKLMIIDDGVAFIGSSNINDRSLLGSRDSEIGVIIEDKEFVDSSMNGEYWKAGKFAFNLRCSLWAEHLGLHGEEVSQITDPVAEHTYNNLWSATAKANSVIYQDVFGCIPNDAIPSRSALRETLARYKDRLGHTTIDLGIAPRKITKENGETKEVDPLERLKSVKGHLVSFPLKFLHQENLKPVFIEGEFYAAPQVFH